VSLKQLVTVVTGQSDLFFVAGLRTENELFMLSVKHNARRMQSAGMYKY